jgi:uncharacterized protein (DUF2384 family)
MKKTASTYRDQELLQGSGVSEPLVLEGYVHRQNYNTLYRAIRNVAFSYQQLYEYVMSLLTAPGVSLQKPKSEVFGDLMEVSESTVYRWRTNTQHVDIKHAERLTALMDIYLYGEEVFGSRPAFIRWLSLATPLLDGDAPLSRMDGTTGLKLLRHILQKIEYGAPL